jgi:diadenosine tetraphosphate (Ap4A) HIT family hydrolase
MSEWGISELNELDQRKFLEGSDNGAPACPFCLELENPSYSLNFLGSTWPFSDRILFSTDHATVIAGYGPQVNPYALVVPRRHLQSVAETTREERASVLDCLDKLLSMGVFPSGKLSIFEHGDCGGRRHHSCLEHCHLHVVDGAIPIAEWLREECLGCEEAALSVDSNWAAGRAYLWAGAYAGNGCATGLINQDGSDRSQFFRRLIARRLGQRKWNWREGMNPDYMRDLVQAAKANI